MKKSSTSKQMMRRDIRKSEVQGAGAGVEGEAEEEGVSSDRSWLNVSRIY
jgi:hypothetical protein